jgi:hypothetical protein
MLTLQEFLDVAQDRMVTVGKVVQLEGRATQWIEKYLGTGSPVPNGKEV